MRSATAHDTPPALPRLAETAPELLAVARASLAWFDRYIELGGPVSGELRALRLSLMAAVAAAEAGA